MAADGSGLGKSEAEDIRGAWGDGPSARYDSLAEKFRPVFQRIAEGAVQRENERILPHQEIGWLTQAGFGALRVPRAYGGAGVTLPELFALLTELAVADSNLTQALRAHFGFVEDVLSSRDQSRRDTWFPRFVAGDVVGNGFTETSGAKVGSFATRISDQGDHWLLNGEKFYTTGSIFAQWIDVAATRGEDEIVTALVATATPGVTVVDDWNGFGQTLTGSGTATFVNARVERGDVLPASGRFRYQAVYYQLSHLSTLSGIARAAAGEVARLVAARRRTYTHATAPVSRQDPQVLQVVGQVHSLAYGAGAITLRAAEAAQRAFEAGLGDDETLIANSNRVAEIEVAQAQVVVAKLVFEATTLLFNALGASATSHDKRLDRHWRNARTVASHNPLIYKERVVGDYAVNGTEPPYLWLAGQS